MVSLVYHVLVVLFSFYAEYLKKDRGESRNFRALAGNGGLIREVKIYIIYGFLYVLYYIILYYIILRESLNVVVLNGPFLRFITK